jgi:hypothetical protein
VCLTSSFIKLEGISFISVTPPFADPPRPTHGSTGSALVVDLSADGLDWSSYHSTYPSSSPCKRGLNLLPHFCQQLSDS